MIYDSLKHLEAYKGIHPGVYRGLKLLTETDFSTLEEKRYEVDGDNLFFSIQAYDSKPVNDTPEAHRKYIWFYRSPTDEITLTGDRFAVFFPGDAHAPCIAVDQPIPCRKCVVKVKV